MRQQSQAVVELALGMAVLMLVAAGLIALSSVTAAELGLVAVAEEAAHAAALAPSAAAAPQLGRERGLIVGRGYALRNGSLEVTVNVDDFRQGGQVDVTATYAFTGRDLFLFGLSGLTVERTHTEPVAAHRSLP